MKKEEGMLQLSTFSGEFRFWFSAWGCLLFLLSAGELLFVTSRARQTGCKRGKIPFLWFKRAWSFSRKKSLCRQFLWFLKWPSWSLTFFERKPIFLIKFNNKEKKIKYSHSYFYEMNNFKSITLETQNGFFGFKIIKSKILNK